MAWTEDGPRAIAFPLAPAFAPQAFFVPWVLYLPFIWALGPRGIYMGVPLGPIGPYFYLILSGLAVLGKYNVMTRIPSWLQRHDRLKHDGRQARHCAC